MLPLCKILQGYKLHSRVSHSWIFLHTVCLYHGPHIGKWTPPLPIQSWNWLQCPTRPWKEISSRQWIDVCNIGTLLFSLVKYSPAGNSSPSPCAVSIQGFSFFFFFPRAKNKFDVFNYTVRVRWHLKPWQGYGMYANVGVIFLHLVMPPPWPVSILHSCSTCAFLSSRRLASSVGRCLSALTDKVMEEGDVHRLLNLARKCIRWKRPQ